VAGDAKRKVIPLLPTGLRDDPAGLPPVRGGFVGRERELDRVGALLMGPARLVTLIGSGGIGKTRLAEEAARRLQRARRTPVFAVRLARLSKGADATAVREAVTAAVLVGGFVGASAWEGAVRRLSPLDAAGRVVDTVLLLDNCEHVLAGVGAVVADLLDAVAGLTILATGRQPVGWIDEQLVTVPALSAKDSLELFRQRAELAGHPITEPGQVALAQQICRHMHGNPLYVRLAAARMFYEPLPMILEQLTGESDDVRMRWRHGPRAGSEGRHRTITDVIAWSYELCGAKQRLLFDRLSVFAPGYDANPEDAATGVADLGAELEAIEVVCADDVSIRGCEGAPSAAGADHGAVRLARAEIRELLERLVEHSLVSIHITADAARYYLLESLRLFAEDRLAERSTEQIDEPARLAARHCHYYRDKVLQAFAQSFGPAEPELLTWTMGAWSNIQRAIDTSIQTAGEAVVGLQIAVGMMILRAPFFLGSLPEIRGRVAQTLAATQASQPQPTELHLAAMALIAVLAVHQGRPEDAEELLERCVAACGAQAAHAGHWRDRPETDIGLPAVVEFAWGVELMLARRDPRAIAVLARAREKFSSVGRSGEVMSGMYEAMAAGFFGSAEQAMTIGQRNLERTAAAGAGWARSWAQMVLAIALTKHGDAEEALQLGRAALACLLPVGDHQWGMMWGVHVRMWSLARLITDQSAAGNTSRRALVKLASEIAYLAGGVKTQQARLGVLIENMGPFGDETSSAEKVARDVLGQQTYADIEKRGSRLFAERSELQRLALGTLSIDASTVDHPATRSTSGWQILSEAEQEVAVLAAAGWPNRAIAVRRGTSTRTTDAQMAKIFEKLMINSREDIARFVPQDQRHRISAKRSHIPRQS
jgi:predicted ATPase/DNA-binding CsgD family transcriptional regulator